MEDQQTLAAGNQTVQIEVQAWDSKILQRACARIVEIRGDDQHPDFGPISPHLAKLGLEYVVVRWPQEDRPRIDALIRGGFEIVDGIVAYKRSVDNADVIYDSHMRLATPHDAKEVADLAARAFRFSRFHSDPAIYREQADQVHYEWALNSCLGSAADAVWLWQENGKVSGFSTVALKGESANIVLVAVGEEYSGRGIAAKLTAKCCEWMKSRGAHVARVQTQSHNVAAQAVYRRCGFEVERLYSTLRWARGHVPINLGRLAMEAFLQLEVEFFREMEELAREVGANINDVWLAVAADARIGTVSYNPLTDPAEDEHIEALNELIKKARKSDFDFKLLAAAASRSDVMELLRSKISAAARWRPVVRKNSE